MKKLTAFIALLLSFLFLANCSDSSSDKPVTYTVTITAEPADYGTVNPTFVTVNRGTELTIEATANEEHIFLRWEGDIDSTDNPATITVNSDMNITGIFGNTHTLTISVDPPGSGSVNPGSGIYVENEIVTLTATPNEGYDFLGWTGDISGTDNPIDVTMDEDKDITVEFSAVSGYGWTAIIHFAIDNNIDYDFEKNRAIVTDYLTTLENIEAADTEDVIDIVVLMDCYNPDTTFQDGYYHLTGGNFNDDLITSITEVESGNPVETQDFMDWAVTNYPATNYFYSVFNHGSGFDDQNAQGTYAAIYGIGFDDSHNDSLSHAELGQVTGYLKGLIGKNIDAVFMYACLMGGVELSYEIRDNADYLIFSEELFPAYYWSYEALEEIVYDSSTTPEELGIAFCDSAYGFFSSYGIPFTLSLIDLSTIDTLYDNIDIFASEAISDIGGHTQALYYIRDAAISFSALTMYGIYDFYYVDLGDFMDNIYSTPQIGSSVRTAADSVTSALDDAVVYQRQYDYPYATGLTIFHNIWHSDYYYDPAIYKSILAFGENTWTDYILLMDSLGILQADSYEPDDNFASANPISAGESQDHSIHVPPDEDYLYVTLTAGNTYEIETLLYSNYMDTRLYLYDSSHTQVAYDNDSGSDFLFSLITYSCTTSGTYYIKVDSFLHYYTGEYTISVNIQ